MERRRGNWLKGVKRAKAAIACAVSLQSGLALGSSVAIPVKPIEAPAVDLVYQGQPIDRDEAIDLQEGGVDLSRLDPVPTDAWQSSKLPVQDDAVYLTYPTDGEPVTFDQGLPSANGLFRTRVLAGPEGQRRPFQLLMSLGGHAALARAALLRKLGFPVPTPRYYRAITVRFKDLATRGTFLDTLSDTTLTARSRWVKSLPENEAEVTLQDVILEPAQIDVPMYHWGIVPAAHLKGRRAVRSLIVPLVLLDITESANLYSWEVGKFVNESAILTHPYAESFSETTFADARWVARRLGELTAGDLYEVVSAGKYPPDVAALFREKVYSRRNHLVDLFRIRDELPAGKRALPYNPKVTAGAVKDGKLTQSEYDGYAIRFTYGDPESPLRKGEIARYLLMQGITKAISLLMGKVNEGLTVQGVSDLSKKHQDQVIQDIVQHAQQNPGVPYSRPIGAWGGPVGGLMLNASRDVVAGTYYGNEGKVSLVDSLAVGANLGFFVGIEGLKYVLPNVSANVAVVRNYIHVRPLADMKSALKSDWGTIFVPNYLQDLGKVLTIDQPAAGDPPQPPDYDGTLKKFLESLKEGEMVMVTDSVVIGAKGNVTIPIPLFMQPGLSFFNPSIGAGIGTHPMMLRRTTFTRTGDGVQVYLQKAHAETFEAEFNFNWVINVLHLEHDKKHGEGNTKAFLLDKEPDTAENRKALAIALKGLIQANDSELLEESFKPYQLRHDVDADVNKAKFLWWQWYGLEESHRVSVTPPGYPDRARTLYSYRTVGTRGIDGYAFFNDIVSAVSPMLSLPGGSKGGNPANSFLGSARWRSVMTEAETTPGPDNVGATSTIEHHWGGWSMSRKHLLKTLDAIDRQMRPLNLDNPIIRRDEFATTKHLQMYEILSTLIVYQQGLDRIGETLFQPASVRTVADTLTEIEGRESLNKWCGKPLRKIFNALFHQNYYTEKENGAKVKIKCVKPWMKHVLKMRKEVLHKKFPSTAEGQIKWTNKIVGTLEKELDVPKFLKWIGKERFFFQVRVSGFRTKDENGDSEYLSDSVGCVNEKQGAGAFREFAAKYGITSNELYARYLSEGY